MPSFLFRNASVLTMDPRRPRATAVLVRGDKITWVGRDEDATSQVVDRVIDCGGATLLPGLNDAHIHLLALASSLRHLDCSRGAAASILDIQGLVRARAQATPPGQWLRGRGYDEFYLKEHRHPTRADLDAAASNHPVRLDHRSGHACVLNSLGLELVGIGLDTPDPPEGVIQRDQEGRPAGLLLEMAGYLSRRMREFREPDQLTELLSETSQALLRWGVTSLQDASPENNMERWHTLRAMREEGALQQRLTFMPGIHHLAQFIGAGLAYGAGDDWLRLGPAKLMLTLTTSQLYPDGEEILALVRDAHHNGFPVAAHAVEEEAIMAVLRAFQESGDSWGDRQLPDRVEHCSEATPKVQMLLTATGATVVTQPGFIYESGERYVATVPPEKQPWLYPLRTLREIRVPLAAGSDAPVASPNPWRGLYSAVTRRSADVRVLHPEQGLPLEDALRLYTAGAAAASGEGGLNGTIQAGAPADLALLDRHLVEGNPERLLTAWAALTMAGGTVLWGG
ncbi:MAG: amidohydrolase [Chloroflexota bacterium]